MYLEAILETLRQIAATILRWQTGDHLQVTETVFAIGFFFIASCAGFVVARSLYNLREWSYIWKGRATVRNTYALALGFTFLSGALISFFLFGENQPEYILVPFIFGTMGYLLSRRRILNQKNKRDLATARPTMPPEEIERSKEVDDRWIMVIGMEQSGKSTVVDALLTHLSEDTLSQWMLTGTTRIGEEDEIQISEVTLTHLEGHKRSLRFWETSQLENGPEFFPELDEFDGILVVIDPVQQESLINSFPQGVRYRLSRYFNANNLIASIEELLQSMSTDFRTTGGTVITRADYLRFSTDPGLVDFPVEVGPDWVKQFSTISQLDRLKLLNLLGISQRTNPQAKINWAAESPFFVGNTPGGVRAGFEEMTNIVIEICD